MRGVMAGHRMALGDLHHRDFVGGLERAVEVQVIQQMKMDMLLHTFGKKFFKKNHC